MSVIRFGDYCCQGGEICVDRRSLTLASLEIARRGRSSLRFSPLGNAPHEPRLALVGITPGSQSEVFAELLRTVPIEVAARKAAFAKGQTQIKELLQAHGFAARLGLDLTGDLNDNPAVLTTSLVKCCLMVDGSYKYKAPDIAANPEATFCVTNRFVSEILRFPTLRWVVIFGDPGWEAVNTLKRDGLTIRGFLQTRGIEVLNFPHFAQNFQQRAIFCLKAQDEAEYLRLKPGHRAYAPVAQKMRAALLAALSRREEKPIP